MAIYRLRDLDNRDDAGEPFETFGYLESLAGYVDGPLRSDLTDPDLMDIDEIVAAMKAGHLSRDYQTQLRQAGVYVDVAGEDHQPSLDIFGGAA